MTLLTALLATPCALAQINSEIEVDMNGSCMGWYIIHENERHLCSADDSEFSYGTCEKMVVPFGVSRFHYGGQESINFEVKSDKDLEIGRRHPTLHPTPAGFQVFNRGSGDVRPNKISIANFSLNIVRDGFPGAVLHLPQYNLDDEVVGCASPETRRLTPRLMRGARFAATASWVSPELGIKNGGTSFLSDADGNLSYAPIRGELPIGNEKPNAFKLVVGENHSITPNPYFWKH